MFELASKNESLANYIAETVLFVILPYSLLIFMFGLILWFVVTDKSDEYIQSKRTYHEINIAYMYKVNEGTQQAFTHFIRNGPA